ncbi:MAG: glycosyltransferase [Dinoroseobacter sp.]|nr:glycosyltransferase [Dinoroseobacter sp.]
MKALLVGRYSENDQIAYAQLYPFFDYRTDLKETLGLEFDHIDASHFKDFYQILETKPDISSYDIFIFRPTWHESPSDAVAFFRHIRNLFPSKKIILLDPWDQATGRFLCVADSVDYIIKYQSLRTPDLYEKEYLGGTFVTDHLARYHNYNIESWDVGSTVPEGFSNRIISGWFITTIPRFKRALNPNLFERLTKPKRSIDIFCRVSYGSKDLNEWYGQHRKEAVDELCKLESEFRLAVSGEHAETKTISSRQYFREIKRAKIAFSPFGWGEVSWRDYEAVAYGCLLIKPSIDHIQTYPDIFDPGKTYVPVKWDLSDLNEKCRYYLNNWNEAEEIIENARNAYLKYFEEKEFIKILKPLIE